MPEGDRPVLVDVLEREVKSRLLSQATEDSLGRRHLRTMQASAVIRGIPEMYAVWKDAMRAAMDEVDDATRVIFAEMLGHILRCIDEKQASEPDAPALGPHKHSRS